MISTPTKLRDAGVITISAVPAVCALIGEGPALRGVITTPAPMYLLESFPSFVALTTSNVILRLVTI